MQALASSSEETVHLSVLDDTDVFYLHKIDSSHPVRAYSEISGRAPAYCVATGKALLAFQPDSYLQRFAENLHAHTARTLATRAALRQELEQVRQQGYAVIFDASRRPLAAIGISGPAERLRPPRMKTLTPDVIRAARDISEALGYTPQ